MYLQEMYRIVLTGRLDDMDEDVEKILFESKVEIVKNTSITCYLFMILLKFYLIELF